LEGCLLVSTRGLDGDLGAADEVSTVAEGSLLCGIVGCESHGLIASFLGPAIRRLVGVAAGLAGCKVLSARDTVTDDEVGSCGYSHVFSPSKRCSGVFPLGYEYIVSGYLNYAIWVE